MLPPEIRADLDALLDDILRGRTIYEGQILPTKVARAIRLRAWVERIEPRPIPPTAPGWYWVRYLDGSEGCEYVAQDEDGALLVAAMSEVEHIPLTRYDADLVDSWSGPIHAAPA